MSQDEFNKVENPALEQLQALGWHYIHGNELTPEKGERSSFGDVVLEGRLEAAIKRINPWINDENARKVIRDITHPQTITLIETNELFWDMLFKDFISVQQDLGDGLGNRGQTVRIIDFDHENIDNNEFLCTNQFKIVGPKQTIFPDIVLFVNGLPLVVIEAKSPYITDPIASSVDQMRRYSNQRFPEEHEGAEKLFWYNQLLVATCRDQAKVGTIGAMAEHYSEWKDAYPFTNTDIILLSKPVAKAELVGGANENLNAGHVAEPEPLYSATIEVTPQQRLIQGMLSKINFLDLLQNFIIFEVIDHRTVKKVARYQQFRAVNKVIDQIKHGQGRKEQSGVIWHTQGSGKSLTMVMLAIKIRKDPDLKGYKLVFVTDRNQLDEQLSAQFKRAQDDTILNAGSVAKLRGYLAKDASDIVTTTVQKFQDAASAGSFKDINTSEKIIVMADEAHRTHFGSLGATIESALPNAPKIGFTGTPLLKSTKMGEAFGGYIDQYKINEAVDDGATVRIVYEGRKANVDVAAESLDSLFDEYFGHYSKEEQEAIKKKYGVERAIAESPARIKRICIDLLEHYKTHIQPDGFKAMIVTGSRNACTVYKDELDKLGAPPSNVIISGDHNDEPNIAQYTDKVQQKQNIQNFTKPFGKDAAGVDERDKKFDNTAFIIVKDMLLTGFDAPILGVMYIDRSLKEHTLMQAIARVNRNYKGKSRGYVVDYFGLANNLQDALQLFSQDEVEGSYHTLKDEIPQLKALHTKVKSIFANVSGGDVDDYVNILKDKSTRSRFEIAFKQFSKQMNVVLPNPAASAFLADLRFWGKVNHSAYLRFHDEQLQIPDVGAKVRELVNEHIFSTGVDPTIPPVDIMAVDFVEHINGVKSDEAKASEVESAILDVINVKLEENPEYYQSFAKQLEEIIRRTEGRWEEQLELLFELRDEMMSEGGDEPVRLGLGVDEYAFFCTLKKEVTGKDPQDELALAVEVELVEITQRLVALVEEAISIIDFFKKDDEIRTIKKSIKHVIVDSSFDDPSLRKTIQERFMDLAKVRYKA